MTLSGTRGMVHRPIPFADPVYVTRPLMPPLADFTALLEDVWESRQLTNAGPQHQALESELAGVFGDTNVSLFGNGTLALLVGCQALRLSGEVITTPFTFPATPHVLSWNGITPVFADIDPETMCLDPSKIEGLITNRTSGILGVHVYGSPCDVDAFDDIAATYGLKVIYDAAHAFGTEIDGKPISLFGDATMFSFHATKLFHSAEGGALVTSDSVLKRRVDLLKNFGIKDPDTVVMPGINGKMNEIQAALGRLVLTRVAAERDRRAQIRRHYEDALQGLRGIRLVRLPGNVTHSEQYLIARVDASSAGISRDELHERLLAFNIVTRKYFSPLCIDYSCYRQLPTADPRQLPHAVRVASEVLALPFHGGLEVDDIERICAAIRYSTGSR